jgi:hypothetical protein
MTRTIFMAVAVRSYWRCVRASPMYRLRPRPQRIRGFERRRLLALPCGLERLMLDLRADRQLAGRRLGGGAGTAGGTGTTRGPVTPEADDRIARPIAPKPPMDTGIALGTVRLLG